jgi:hypothetical protein
MDLASNASHSTNQGFSMVANAVLLANNVSQDQENTFWKMENAIPVQTTTKSQWTERNVIQPNVSTINIKLRKETA